MAGHETVDPTLRRRRFFDLGSVADTKGFMAIRFQLTDNVRVRGSCCNLPHRS